MRLLLADDHTLFREALVQFIERADPAACVTVARDMQEVMGIMETGPVPDLVLLDLRMPGMDGLKGLETLRSAYPETSVALISGFAEKSHVQKAMQLGAAGFFPKTMSGRAMINGIRKILEGGAFVPIDHNSNDIMASYYHGNAGYYDSGGLGDGAQDGYEISDASLTPRESEVLSFLLRGASNKEIAMALGLQVVTVKLHVRGICRKLKARNRTQAALKAQQMGLS